MWHSAALALLFGLHIRALTPPRSELYDGTGGQMYAIAVNPNNFSEIAVAGPNKEVRVWDVSTRQRRLLTGHTAPSRAVVYSPTRPNALITSSDDAIVMAWNSVSGIVQSTLVTGHTNGVRGLAVFTSGAEFVTASFDNSLKRSNFTDVLQTYSNHSASVLCVAVNPFNGSEFASGGSDFVVRLWDKVTGVPTRLLRGHTNTVAGIAFHPFTANRLLTASHDATVRLWDTTSGLQLRQFSMHTSLVNGIAFNPTSANQGQFVSVSQDNSAIFWDTASGNCLGAYRTNQPLDSVAYNLANTAQIYVTLANGSIFLWDGPLEQCPNIPPTPPGPVQTRTPVASVPIPAPSPTGLSLGVKIAVIGTAAVVGTGCCAVLAYKICVRTVTEGAGCCLGAGGHKDVSDAGEDELDGADESSYAAGNSQASVDLDIHTPTASQ